MAKYYFDANLTGVKQFIQGIPMFAVHAGQTYTGGWESAFAEDFGGFQFIMAKVNVQVPVHLAMPRYYAEQHFKVGDDYSKIAVYAFRPRTGSSWQSDGGYMVGSSIVMVIKTIKVVSVTPIPQFKGLPVPPQVQKNYLEKKIGSQAYSAVAVTLWAAQGDIVPAYD